MRKTRVIVSWSTGKDSAWTLYRLQQMPDIEIVGLLTTVNAAFQRVAMHAVREALLEAQAGATGLPLIRVPIPWPCTNAQYEEAMRRIVYEVCPEMGVTHMAFGDLFLEDVRAYRETRLEGTGITPLFPLWGEPTDRLAAQMVREGLEAVITCVNPKQLPETFAGRVFDAAFLSELPEGVDPCGERGEFHSFVYKGPMFRHPLSVVVGEIVERDGFVFADVLLSERRLERERRRGSY